MYTYIYKVIKFAWLTYILFVGYSIAASAMYMKNKARGQDG